MAFDLDNYMTAEERIELFAADNPDMRMISYHDVQNEWVFVKVCIFRKASDTEPWASGLAGENLKTQFAIEKSETSAYARAITNLGLVKYSTRKDGSKAPRANKAEMEKVVPFKPKYGAVGSRSAAVEEILRNSFDTPEVKAAINKEPVPWSIGDVVDAIPTSTPTPPIECEHGHTLKQGMSNKTKKPYYGYICNQGICNPIWAKVTANGHWYFEDDSNG